MGSISKAIEKKKREIMWLKIKLGMKIAAAILGPVILGIIIHVIKKKTKKQIRAKIKEKIITRNEPKAQEDDELEIYDETID